MEKPEENEENLIEQNSLENLEKENEFLRTQCKSYEKQLEDLQKENQKLSENLSKTYEELELYKSIFLVKNLEIKYQPIKANILKSSNNNHHPKYFSNEKPLTPLKFDQKSINIEIPPYEDNDLEKFQENKTKNLTNDSFLFRFLDLYEKFKILKHYCEMLKFEFIYLYEEMKSLINFVENEINFEIPRIVSSLIKKNQEK